MEIGVQGIYKPMQILDSGACPGPASGFSGMTETLISGHFRDHHFFILLFEFLCGLCALCGEKLFVFNVNLGVGGHSRL